MRNSLISFFLTMVAVISFNTWGVEKQAPFKVAILMFDNVQIIDFSAPYEVFGQAGFEVYTVSPSGKQITTTMGLKVIPDHNFDSLPEVNAILVPGGDVSVISKDIRVLNWLREQHDNVSNLISVCTGSDIIARSGLLNGLSATTFYKNIDNLANDYPEVTVLDNQRFVDNGKIITSAGLSSGIDASLYLVSKIKGIESAKTVAMHIEYDWQQNDVFIRATMADKNYPTNKYQWADTTKFSDVISYGDKGNWYRSYKIETLSNTDKLKNIYSKAMAANIDWVSKKTTAKNTLLWHKIIDGNVWELNFTVQKDNNGKVSKLINTLSNISTVKGLELAQIK